jgi:uncharacterized protein YigE (DUF2233 family)
MNAGMYHEDRRPVGLYASINRGGGGSIRGILAGSDGLFFWGCFIFGDFSADIS